MAETREYYLLQVNAHITAHKSAASSVLVLFIYTYIKHMQFNIPVVG